MIFIPPRFVVVDDKPEHLTAILGVFQKLGTPCLGIAYDAERELEARSFAGVRALFLDLHLIDLAATTDESRHFAVIAGILEENISPGGGPFVLVVWTEHEDSVEQLTEYLDESLDPDKPHARPLAIVNLPKSRFINADTGEPLEGKAGELRDAVEAAVSKKPQLAALVAWEADVQAAAGATLSALMELVPEEHRSTASFAHGLDEVLSRLAREAVGQPHVAVDPRAAITSALAPILADRIVNQQVPPGALETWRAAVTWEGREPLDPIRAGMVNRMLHLAIPPSETIRPVDWGAVVEFPEGWWNDDGLRSRFGVTLGQLLGQEFKIGRADRERCRPRLVRVGAACDHAHDRSGPLPYLLGLEIPSGVERQPDNTGTVRLPASEWSSPTLSVEPNEDPFVLVVNSRYSLSVTRAEAEGWRRAYRLREQLLMHLISHASSYQARPGIVQF